MRRVDVHMDMSRARHAPTTRRATASAQRVLVLTVADQGASSVSNFALAVIVAHYSSASALGVFAILTTTYVLSQGLVRSLSSDCLMTRSEADGGLRLTYERAGYLAAIVLSTALAALVLAVSGVLPSEFTLPFVIFAVSFPLMACQDYARYIGISRYDPGYAIRLDAAWLVLFLAAYVVVRHAGLTSLPWLFGAWSATGLWSACGLCAPSWPAEGGAGCCASGTRASAAWVCGSPASSCS